MISRLQIIFRFGHRGLLTALVPLLAGPASAILPPVSHATDYAHFNRTMTAPRLIHSHDPAYTKEALDARIEGTVVLQVVLGTQGAITYASVLSPLPGGLDEKALEAVRDWRYTPAQMDMVTIPVLTTIDVVFKLPYQSNRPPLQPLSIGVQQAPALAQSYEAKGDREQARRYYRLCAAAVNPDCQYHLGKLLVTGPDVNPNDFTQGVAWLQLANEHGNQAAGQLLSTASAKLSSIQFEWVAQVKPHLEQKRH